jgi:hypothetical protein
MTKSGQQTLQTASGAKRVHELTLALKRAKRSGTALQSTQNGPKLLSELCLSCWDGVRIHRAMTCGYACISIFRTFEPQKTTTRGYDDILTDERVRKDQY